MPRVKKCAAHIIHTTHTKCAHHAHTHRHRGAARWEVRGEVAKKAKSAWQFNCSRVAGGTIKRPSPRRDWDRVQTEHWEKAEQGKGNGEGEGVAEKTCENICLTKTVGQQVLFRLARWALARISQDYRGKVKLKCEVENKGCYP